jgi:hypothetical protein
MHPIHLTMTSSQTLGTEPAKEGLTNLGATGVATDTGSAPEGQFPLVHIDGPDPSEATLTRRGILHAKEKAREQRKLAFDETRGMQPSPEKTALYRAIQACVEEERELENRLEEYFVPQHGPNQFLSPRAFFQSPLFSASNKKVGRARMVDIALPSKAGLPSIRYNGPELRQSDGRVFLAILHMLRDVEVGTRVNIKPELVCRAIFGRYDGGTRGQLHQHIQRLQKGIIETDKYSVQLCLGFDYPKRGPWSVALDKHIVELFRISPEVWLSMRIRLSLPEGLATWLYTFIESQTKLIPMKISTLRTLCGSESQERAFVNSLRRALKTVADTGIIDTGWTLRDGEVRWLKKKKLPSPH